MSERKKRGQKQETTLRQVARYISDDPLWNETPELGPEGLIGTIEDKDELIRKLMEVAQKRTQFLTKE